MRRMLTLLIFAAVLMAAPVGIYVFEHKAALTGAAEVLTVQFAAGTTRTLMFTSASVYCSVQCEITLERDGTAATTTAVMVPELNRATWSAAQAYYSSNVGTGTVIGRQIIGAGQVMVLELVRKTLAAGQNFSIRTDSITGTTIINIKWEEF